MNEMKMYAWLLPLLFILHDMEEIIFARKWKNGEDKRKVYIKTSFVPFGAMKNTEGFAIAVYEELLILCAVSCYSYFTGQYGLWFGLLAGNIIHLIVLHLIGLPAVYHAYVPGFVIALLTVVPNIFILYKCYEIMQYGLLKSVLYIVIGTFIAMINMKFLHSKECLFSSLLQ